MIRRGVASTTPQSQSTRAMSHALYLEATYAFTEAIRIVIHFSCLPAAQFGG
jgi:hypothetical protein